MDVLLHHDDGSQRWTTADSEAHKRRLHAADRARAFEILGWTPERYGPCHPDSHCCTTAEAWECIRWDIAETTEDNRQAADEYGPEE